MAMSTVRRTNIFNDWLNGLKHRRAAARIAARILPWKTAASAM